MAWLLCRPGANIEKRILITCIFGLELFGAQGGEAGGPSGFLLGALIGLIGGGVLLFGRRTGT